MYFLLFVLLRKNLMVEGVQCCNKEDDIQEHLQFDDNPDNLWNTEFVCENIDLKYLAKLFTIDHISQKINISLKQSKLGYECIIDDDQQSEIIFLQLGMFQQVFIQYDQHNLGFYWYQNFEQIYHKIFTFLKKDNIIIKNHQNYLCWQTIQLKNMNNFLDNCQNQFHINIQMNPLLMSSLYYEFNNNFYCLEFWIKYNEYTKRSQQIIIQKFIGDYDAIKFFLQQGGTFIYLDEINYVFISEISNPIWNYYQLSYSRSDQRLQYKSLNELKEFQIKQQFEYGFQLKIIPNIEQVVFTGLIIHLIKNNFHIQCPPGCLQCQEQGYCIECDKKYLLIKGYCECQQNFEFFVSPSECYVEMDYIKIYSNEKQSATWYLYKYISPTYDGQLCQQYLNQFKSQPFSYCLYNTDIPFQHPQIELQQNIYYLYIVMRQKLIINDMELPRVTKYFQLINLHKARKILCRNNYYLDREHNQCKEQYSEIFTYNQNMHMHDYDSIFSIYTFIYYNYSNKQMMLTQNQYYIPDCQLLNGLQRGSIIYHYCNKTKYISLSENCKFYCNKCLLDQRCVDYKYLIQFHIKVTISRDVRNNLLIQNNNNYYNLKLVNISITNYLFSITKYINTNRFNQSDINQLIDFQNQLGNTSILIFQHVSFECVLYQIEEQIFIIRDSIIQILCFIEFNSNNNQFYMKNVQLRGPDQNESILLFNLSLLGNFQLENVQILNHLMIEIYVHSEGGIIMCNVTLQNLIIRNYNFQNFNLFSDQVVIENLYIFNCTFNNTLLFRINSNQVNLRNIILQDVEFHYSQLFKISAKNMIDGVQLLVEKLSLNQVLCDQSEILFSQSYIRQGEIYHLLINNSKFSNSKFIDFHTFYGKYQYAQNLKFFFFRISGSDFFCSAISIIGQSLMIENFYFRDNRITNLFLDLSLDKLSIDNMKLVDCQIYFQDQPSGIVFLNSDFIQIKDIFFFNLKTYNLLIKCAYEKANINNIIFHSIEASFQLLFFDYFIHGVLDIVNITLQDIYFIQGQILINLEAQSISIKYFQFYEIHENQMILINLFSDNIYIQELNAYSVYAYVLFRTESRFIQFKAIKLTQISILQVFEFVQNKDEGSIIMNGLFVNQSISVGQYLIYVDCQKLSLLKFENMIFNHINSNNIFYILLNRIKLIELEEISITQSNTQTILRTLGKIERLTVHSDKLYDIQGLSSILTNCESIQIKHIIFKQVENLIIQANFTKFDVLNLTISDSQIIQIKFQDVSELKNQTSIITAFYLNNNIFQSFLFLSLNGFVQGLKLINNTIVQDYRLSIQYLLLAQGQINIQILMVRNKCISYCIGFMDSEQKFDLFSEDNQEQEQFIQNITDPFPINSMAIRINNNILIKNQSQLYLPSGQQLTKYQIYDQGQMIQYFQSVQIIQHQENQDYVINGQFYINSFEYSIYKKKIIKNITQQQNFQQFDQNSSYLGLNYFQINFNHYQNNIIMIIIVQVSDLEKKIIIFASTQVCQMGEILYQDQCLICDPKLQIYSVKQKSNFCQTVDTLMISDHQQGSIKLRQGYWRPFIYSSQIVKCEGKLSQCQGGWHVGVDSCEIGYFGGICNACDQYNLRGHGYFQQENNKCKQCGELLYLNLFLEFLVVIFIHCLRLIFQLNSNIQNQKKIILQRSVNYRNFHVIVKYIQDMPPMVFNITIANLAFLRFILQDYVDLPNMITIFTNPVLFEKNSKTCLQLIIDHNQTYWIQILRVVMPILTYNIFIILLIITSQNKKQIKNVFLFPVLSLFFSQGPTILVLFIQQTLYVTYSKVRYAYFDNGIRYFSHNHQLNLKYLVLPIIIIFSLILPLIIYLIIKRLNVNLLKGQRYITGGNFIIPYNNKYQEIFNYIRNVILLLILMLDDHYIIFHNKALIYILIIYIENQYTIHRLRKISFYSRQQGIWLVSLLIISNNLNIFLLPTTEIIYILVSLFIIQSFQFYLKLLFFTNKLLIYETFKNQKKIIYFLGLTNYYQCFNYWKSIKLNYKALVRGKQVKKDQMQNEIKLKTQYTQQTDQSLVLGYQEIEMKQL